MRRIVLLMGTGVERVGGVESAWCVCKKHGILYDTANLTSLLERPLAAPRLHFYLKLWLYDDSSNKKNDFMFL